MPVSCQLVQCGVTEARHEPRETQSGRGHGCFCNLLIIRYHNNEGVETWPKKCLRFHALFYKSLKISLSKKGVWPRPAGDAYRSCSNDALFPLGCIECIFRSIRDIHKILESGYLFQFGYGHHVLCLRPMAFFHRMSHHECYTFKFRCRT